MAQEGNETRYKANFKLMRTIISAIGIGCILQFFIVGVINIIRGYSIRSHLPVIILFAGVFLIILFSQKQRKRPMIGSYYSLIASFAIIYISLIGLSHGRYMKKAEGYYSRGQYVQALQACEKEAQTWYNLLRYNYQERKAMNMMAKAYCQLEDFDRARDTYNLMIDRYSGEFYGYRAQESLGELEMGLEIVAYYPDRIKENLKKIYIEESDVYIIPKNAEVRALYDIARVYRYDMKCYAKAIEVYTKILGKDISEELKERAKEQIVELRDIPKW